VPELAEPHAGIGHHNEAVSGQQSTRHLWIQGDPEETPLFFLAHVLAHLGLWHWQRSVELGDWGPEIRFLHRHLECGEFTIDPSGAAGFFAPGLIRANLRNAYLGQRLCVEEIRKGRDVLAVGSDRATADIGFVLFEPDGQCLVAWRRSENLCCKG
jgi:hypothetical protein